MTDRIVSEVSIIEHSDAGIFIVNAMSDASTDDTFLSHFKMNDDCKHPIVKVEMTVNGVPVDFRKTLEDIFDIFESKYDETVKKAALDLVSGSRLQKLSQALENAEWQIEDEINRILKQE